MGLPHAVSDESRDFHRWISGCCETTTTIWSRDDFSDEECETPCTYTECILSVFLSGIPSVYVTGGYTGQRWTSLDAASLPMMRLLLSLI